MRRRWQAALIAAITIGAAGLLATAPATAHAATVTTAKYTAGYTRTGPTGLVTGWSCSGKWKLDTSTGNATETETCIVSGSTAGMAAGTYTGDPSGPMPGLAGVEYAGGGSSLVGTDTFAWYSDYDGVQATSWTIVVTKDGKGGAFKFKITADYAANPVTYTLLLIQSNPTLTVIGTPGAINCQAADCTYSYDADTNIELASANPVGITTFAMGCTVNGEQTCALTLNGNITVTVSNL